MVLDGFRNEDNGSIRVNKNPSPFTTVKPKDPNDAQYWTLSHGAFPEVFEQKEQENYGHITFKTGTKKITTIDTASKTGFLIDPVAFAYDFGARMYDARLGIFTSVDPLSHKYPQWSPYSAFQNNPIIYIDIDGREVVPANARANAIFQLALTQTFGEEVAGVFQNAYTFKNRYSKLRSYSSIDTQSKEFKSAIKNIDDEETRQLAYQLAEAINNENINFVDALEDETAKSLDRGDAATQVGNYVFDFLNSGTGQPQNPSVVDLQGGATSTVSPSTVGSNAASYTAVSTEDISGTYTANTNREGYTISNDFKISNTSLNREQSQGFLRWLVAGSKAASTNPTTNLKAKEELRTSKPSFE
ncbi:MAG: hypothetical protein HYY40_14015 [Bacteroidetes bacterium]|nr:hypothetical protein [Bacteroidota bacterium]